jgi:hypothetical protein
MTTRRNFSKGADEGFATATFVRSRSRKARLIALIAMEFLEGDCAKHGPARSPRDATRCVGRAGYRRDLIDLADPRGVTS